MENPCEITLEVGSSSLSLGDIWPLFIVLGAGTAMSVVCLLLEILFMGMISYACKFTH